MCLKRKVFDQCVLPAMTYGCETWTLNNRLHQKLQTSQGSMERYMLSVTRRDRKRNEWIRSQTKVTDIIYRIKTLKWKWAGHIARVRDERLTNSIINWVPLDIKRSRRMPGARWMVEIKKYAGVRWQRKAGNRQEWWKLGVAFVQQWTDIGWWWWGWGWW